MTQWNSSRSIYIPYELDKIQFLLKLEWTLITFFCLVFNLLWLYNHSIVDSIYVMLPFLLLPLIFLFSTNHLIQFIQKLQQDVLHRIQYQIYTMAICCFIGVILNITYFDLIPIINKILLLIWFACISVINISKVQFLNRVKTVSIIWNHQTKRSNESFLSNLSKSTLTRHFHSVYEHLSVGLLICFLHLMIVSVILLNSAHLNQNKTPLINNAFIPADAKQELVILKIHNPTDASSSKQMTDSQLKSAQIIIDDLTNQLSKEPWIQWIRYRFPKKFFETNAALYTELNELALIYTKLKQNTNLPLYLQTQTAQFQLNKLQSISIAPKNININNDGYYIDTQPDSLLILLKMSSLKKGTKLTEIIENTKLKFIKESPNISIEIIGQPLTSISKNLYETFVILSIVLLTISIIHMRSVISGLFFCFLPALSITLISMAGVGLMYPSINYLLWIQGFVLFTISFLVHIQWMQQFRKVRKNHSSFSQAIDGYLKQSKLIRIIFGLSLILSLALIFITPSALSQLGLLIFLGSLFNLLSVFYILPCLLFTLFRRLHRYYNRISTWIIRSVSTSAIATVFSLLIFDNIYLLHQYIERFPVNSWISIPIYFFIIPYFMMMSLALYFLKGQSPFSISLPRWNTQVSKWMISITLGVFIVLTVIWTHIGLDWTTPYPYETSPYAKTLNHLLYFTKVSTSIDESYVIHKKWKEQPLETIAHIESISQYIPQQQKEKRQLIQEILNLLNIQIKQFQLSKTHPIVSLKQMFDNNSIIELKNLPSQLKSYLYINNNAYIWTYPQLAIPFSITHLNNHATELQHLFKDISTKESFSLKSSFLIQLQQGANQFQWSILYFLLYIAAVIIVFGIIMRKQIMLWWSIVICIIGNLLLTYLIHYFLNIPFSLFNIFLLPLFIGLAIWSGLTIHEQYKQNHWSEMESNGIFRIITSHMILWLCFIILQNSPDANIQLMGKSGQISVVSLLISSLTLIPAILNLDVIIPRTAKLKRLKPKKKNPI